MRAKTACLLFVAVFAKTDHSNVFEPIGWGYEENPIEADETNPCGHDEVLGDCGPENWKFAFAECEAKGQSPIDMDSHTHESHHLNNLKWILSDDFLECKRAVIEMTSYTYNVSFAEDLEACHEAYTLEFHEHEYVARHFQIHHPSEHTLHHEHLDLEVQFVHANADGHLVIVSVLVKASDEFGENSFLRYVLEAVDRANLTIGHEDTQTFPKGTLNFVDTFLPSRGLSYNYYTYTGSLTVPSCAEATWIVMAEPAFATTHQIEQFKSAFLNASGSAWSSHGENARPIQELSPIHNLELFIDDFCYERYCHNLFRVGKVIDVTMSIAFLGLLILFTTIFEFLTAKLDEHVKSFHTTMAMVSHVYKELSILGVVSFIAVCIIKSCSFDIAENLMIAFEVMHIFIFSSGIAFVLFSGIILRFTYNLAAHWDKLLTTHEDILHGEVTKTHRFHLLGQAWIGQPLHVVDLGTCFMRGKFIEIFGLPHTFDFQKYIMLFLAHTVAHMLDIEFGVWIVGFLYLLMCIGLMAIFPTNQGGFIFAGIVLLLLICLAINLAYLSFTTVLKLSGITSFETLKTKAEAAQKESFEARSHLEAEEIAKGHYISLEGTKKKVLDKRKSTRISLKGPKAFFAGEAAAEKPEKEEADKSTLLSKAWRPFGSPFIINVVFNSCTLCMSFYFCLYILFVREFMEWYGHLITSVIIAVGVCSLIPRLIVTKSLVKCLTDLDRELIGKVLDYATEKRAMQKELTDFLFPDLELRLMERTDFESVIRKILRPEDIVDNTVHPKRLVERLQDNEMNLSFSKVHRFKRLLDKDRSGTVEMSEIVELMDDERLYRIDKRLLEGFQRYSSQGSVFSLSIPRSKIHLVLSDVYRGQLPQEVKDRAAASFGAANEPIEYLTLRNWFVQFANHQTPQHAGQDAQTMADDELTADFGRRRNIPEDLGDDGIELPSNAVPSMVLNRHPSVVEENPPSEALSLDNSETVDI